MTTEQAYAVANQTEAWLSVVIAVLTAAVSGLVVLGVAATAWWVSALAGEAEHGGSSAEVRRQEEARHAR